eukprot:scaffold8191_cov132-Isochrysis_galbana.AAC.3
MIVPWGAVGPTTAVCRSLQATSCPRKAAGRVCSHALGFHSRPFHRSVPGGVVAVLAVLASSPRPGGAAASVPSTHRSPPSPAPFFPPSPVVGAPLPSRAVWLRAAPGGRGRPSA